MEQERTKESQPEFYLRIGKRIEEQCAALVVLGGDWDEIRRLNDLARLYRRHYTLSIFLDEMCEGVK